MDLIKVKNRFQITIPAFLRKQFNIAEGDYMEIENSKNGILIKPVKVIHPDQEYFYTKEWQKGEAEADRDIAEGNMLGPFDNADEVLEALKTAKI